MQLFETMDLVTFALAGLAMALPISLLADANKNAEIKKLQESEATTKSWLSLIDAAQYDKSWDAASKVLQLTVPRAQWTKIMDQIRKPLGKPVSRKVTDVRTSKDPHGLPPGDYMVYVYQTKFPGKDDSYEMLTLVYDESKWQVMTYQVN
jgi:hypothetical protein